MSTIDKYISENNNEKAIEECINKNLYYLAFLLSKATKINKFDTDIYSKLNDSLPEHLRKNILFSNKIRVLLTCSWTSSDELCKLWSKMSKNKNCWNEIQIVSSEPADYYCVINRPSDNNMILDKKKTILFRMEPNMEQDVRQWGPEWCNPNINDFLFVGNHNLHLNNLEWHLSKNYNELSNDIIEKNDSLSNILTTILSDKYIDKGHIKRVDFVKYLEKKGVNVDVYGSNKFLWKNYKGSLPYHEKDDSLFPYKYSFNCENHSIKNYCTEKLVDGILAETLVFYSGCYNIKDYIDEKAFVYLELSNFEQDYQLIKKAIEEDWWTQRLPYIKEAKNKILNELQFFPRLENIIKKNDL
uniref:Fucosyltransferase C-terminal domain-containing protein n=1 Tax=viral metagenome TaxID=1070528 RepID=A0A6C0E0G6_9ZZZZ